MSICMVKRRLRTLLDFTTSFGNAKLTSSILRQSSSKIVPANMVRFFARPIRIGLDLGVFSQHKRLRKRFTINFPGSRGKITQQNGKRSRSKGILAILPDPMQKKRSSRKRSRSERSAIKELARQ